MRSLFGLVLLVLATALFAETQEEAYYRAMKAEEAGDITAALKAFEEAAALPGEYTEEIQGIIRDYKAALGSSSDDSTHSTDFDNSWEFHVSGEVGLWGMHYKETGMDEGEMGGNLMLIVNPYVDYTAGAWTHTFAANVQGNYFLNNDNMSVLDTNDWNMSFGLEYTLFSRSLFLDVGYDFIIEGDDLSSLFSVIVGKDLYRADSWHLNLMGIAIYQTSGPMSCALNLNPTINFSDKLKGVFYLGVKFEADSLFDYKAYEESYLTATTSEEIVFREYYGKWFGPLFRTKLFYKFNDKLTISGFAKMFYGFMLDGPDTEYEKVRRFNITYGAQVSWKYWKMNYYLELERNCWCRSLPDFYKKYLRERSAMTQLKLGVKWDI